MKNLKNYSQIFTKSLILSLGLTLVACGGGGSGSGGNSQYPSIQYSGNTNQATVTEGNSKDFPVTMLEGSSASASANPYGAVTSEASLDVQHGAMINLLAEQIKENILKPKNTASIASGATSTITGNCSGNQGTLIEVSNTSGTVISGSLTYNNFCTTSAGYDFTLHGKINITVNYNGSTDANSVIIYNVAVNVEYLKMTVTSASGTFSEEFSGSMAITFDGTVNNTISNITVSTQFQANGFVYKVENLVVNKAGGTLSISGRFYHPVHGYVDVTTPAGKEFNLISTEPDKYCGGTLQVNGNGGSFEFTANSDCSSFDICYTAAGDAACTTPTTYSWPK